MFKVFVRIVSCYFAFSLSKSFHVVLLSVPPTPQNVKIRRTSPTTIDVMWNQPAFPVAGYRVYYNMFALPNMDLWQSIDVGPYTVAEITGLDPQTIYVVRVQAISTSKRFGNLSASVYTNMIPRGKNKIKL